MVALLPSGMECYFLISSWTSLGSDVLVCSRDILAVPQSCLMGPGSTFPGLPSGHKLTLQPKSFYLQSSMGPFLVWHHVLFHVNNMAVVTVVHNLNTSDSFLCQLLLSFYFYAAHYHFTFSSTHIASTLNKAADALSLGNLSLFHSLYPQVSQHLIPPPLYNIFLSQVSDRNSPS